MIAFILNCSIHFVVFSFFTNLSLYHGYTSQESGTCAGGRVPSTRNSSGRRLWAVNSALLDENNDEWM